MANDIAHAHEESHTKSYFSIWFWLLLLTAVEVVLAYVQVFSTRAMLLILMALSLVKAAMIMAYFMHLRFERMSLVLSLIPAVIVVIGLLFAFFPDGYRLLELKVR